MSEKPYMIAAVGGVLGSPAPMWLTLGHQRESALGRLQDVFKIGDQGQAFRDFTETGRRLGKSDAEIVAEWREYEQLVVRAAQPMIGTAYAGNSHSGVR
jgi:hypothetical protein